MAGISKEAVLAGVRGALSPGSRATMEDVAAAGGVSVRTLYRLFGSRDALLRELDHEPESTSRARILEAGLELVGKHGLEDLSMDNLAAAASVSRATLYRLFPGKSALFRELIQTYSPWEPIADVIHTAKDHAPEHVMPEVGRVLAEAMQDRTGLLLRMVFEMVKGEADTNEGIRRSMSHGLPDLIGYLGAQMKAGRLRKMHPVVAFQLFAGPIVAHLLTRPLAGLVGFRTPQDQVVKQIAEAWLRAMAPPTGTQPASTAKS